MRLTREQLSQAMTDAHADCKRRHAAIKAFISYAELFAEILGDKMRLQIYIISVKWPVYPKPFRTYDERRAGL